MGDRVFVAVPILFGSHGPNTDITAYIRTCIIPVTILLYVSTYILLCMYGIVLMSDGSLSTVPSLTTCGSSTLSLVQWTMCTLWKARYQHSLIVGLGTCDVVQ